MGETGLAHRFIHFVPASICPTGFWTGQHGGAPHGSKREAMKLLNDDLHERPHCKRKLLDKCWLANLPCCAWPSKSRFYTRWTSVFDQEAGRGYRLSTDC